MRELVGGHGGIHVRGAEGAFPAQSFSPLRLRTAPGTFTRAHLQVHSCVRMVEWVPSGAHTAAAERPQGRKGKMSQGKVLSDDSHTQLAAVEKAGVKGGWEVGRRKCLMPRLELGDLGQVPCLGLPLPICSLGVTTPGTTLQGGLSGT